MNKSTLAIPFIFILIFLQNQLSIGQTLEKTSSIFPKNNDLNYLNYGQNVSIKDSIIIVTSQKQVVQVYKMAGGTWTEYGNLSFSIPDSKRRIISIDQTDSLILIGTETKIKNELKNFVYIFEKYSSNWINKEEIDIISSPDNGYTGFGIDLVVNNNRIIIGAPKKNNNEGGAFEYKLINNKWSLVHSIENPDTEKYKYFGRSLAIDNETLVIGSGYISTFWEFGAIHIYEVSLGENLLSYSQSIRNVSGDGTDFGFDIDILDNTIVVGAPTKDVGYMNSAGVAYVIQKNDNYWDIVAELNAIPNSDYERLGEKVIIQKGMIAVSISGKNNNWGSIAIFNDTNGEWLSQNDPLIIDNPNTRESDDEQEYFGRIMSISGKNLIVGIPRSNKNDIQSGQAYYSTLNDLDNLNFQELNISKRYNQYTEYGLIMDVYDSIMITSTGRFDTLIAELYILNNQVWKKKLDLQIPEPGKVISLSIYENNIAIGVKYGVATSSVFYFDLNDAVDEIIKAKTKILPESTGVDFGRAVKINNNILVISEPYYSYTNIYQGRILIYRTEELFSNSSPEPIKEYRGPDSRYGNFGRTIALNDHEIGVASTNLITIIKADKNWNSFESTNNYSPTSLDENSNFGKSMDLSDSLVVVGDPGNYEGRVYIFNRSRQEENQILYSNDPFNSDNFGISVDLYHNYLVIGNSKYNSKGRLEFFVKEDNWKFDNSFDADYEHLNIEFGASIFCHGNSIIVGSPGYSGSGDNSGIISNYIYKTLSEPEIETYQSVYVYQILEDSTLQINAGSIFTVDTKDKYAFSLEGNENFILQSQDRLLKIIPKENVNGDFDFLINLSIGGLSSEAEFKINIIPVNDPPSFHIVASNPLYLIEGFSEELIPIESVLAPDDEIDQTITYSIYESPNFIRGEIVNNEYIRLIDTPNLGQGYLKVIGDDGQPENNIHIEELYVINTTGETGTLPYPNPSISYFSFEGFTKGYIDLVQVNIFDNDGSKLECLIDHNQKLVHLSNVKSGIYVVEIITTAGNFYHKLLVNK